MLLVAIFRQGHLGVQYLQKMIKDIFYNSIDRMLPSCYFCLQQTAKTLLKVEPSLADNLDDDCFYFPNQYAILSIKQAIIPIYQSCINSKYNFLLIDRILKNVFFITKELKSYLTQYRKPRNIQDVIKINQNSYKMLFFQGLFAQGFLLKHNHTAPIDDFKSQFKLVRLLANNNSNKSYLVQNKRGQILYLKQLLKRGTNYRAHFVKEIEIIKNLQDCGCVLKLIDYNIESMYYVTEYVQGTNLEDFYLVMQFQEKISLIKQIINIMSILHSRNIIHGDIHLGQFILSDTDSLKLIDYETLGVAVEKQIFPYMGATFEYIEPESLSENPFKLLQKEDMNFKAEVYRIGVLVYTLIYKIPPFYEISWKMLCNSKLQDTIVFNVTDNEGNHIPSWLIALMKKCLYKNPKLRFSSAC